MNTLKNRIVKTDCVSPYTNLAAEALLFTRQGESDCVTLYLWQNERTVVIGKNQNAWQECRLSLLTAEGGLLARRTTGGGAVFHDLGNLNFSFILPRRMYDVSRQLSVIVRALRALGVSAEASGRNDLILSGTGEKFSGNAFCFNKTAALHHGTLLVDADLSKLSRYLSPPEQKYRAKGIASVRSRVANLTEQAPQLSIPALSDELCRAFVAEYGPAEGCALFDELPEKAWREETDRLASDAWRLGHSPSFDAVFSTRLPLGQIELHLTMENGLVSECAVFSDAMDPALPETLSHALPGCPFLAPALAERALLSTGNAPLSEWIRTLAL